MSRRFPTSPCVAAGLPSDPAIDPDAAFASFSDSQGDGSIYNPAYVVYENNAPTKVALFNFVTDESGASDVTASLSVGGLTEGTTATTPTQVFVRYWNAPTAGEQFDVRPLFLLLAAGRLALTRSLHLPVRQITWAGQSAGSAGPWTSDGTLSGEIKTTTVDCSSGICAIPLKAPSFALVFLSQEALDAVDGTVEAIVDGVDQAATTFATTYNGGGVGTATGASLCLSQAPAARLRRPLLTRLLPSLPSTVAQEVLETSNGRVTGGHVLGSTSKGGDLAAEDEASHASRRTGLGVLAASVVAFGAGAFYLAL